MARTNLLDGWEGLGSMYGKEVEMSSYPRCANPCNRCLDDPDTREQGCLWAQNQRCRHFDQVVIEKIRLLRDVRDAASVWRCDENDEYGPQRSHCVRPSTIDLCAALEAYDKAMGEK